VVKILKIINDAFGNVIVKIPCHNTIENWVKKCGLEAYNASGKKFKKNDYAQIVDESMMIGSEKLLLTLGVPANHQNRPLACNDVAILDIAVTESWNGEGVKNRLITASQKVGREPKYVISDNASIMSKGIRESGFKHHRDISHSLGMFLERAYKKESDFINYCKLMTEPKFKYNMKKIAYLLPPKQRTIARFINLSGWIRWSFKMLKIYHNLSVEEQQVFSFIPANASLIEELSKVQKCVHKIESYCKKDGLSTETVEKCQYEINQYLTTGNMRMINLGNELINFLKEEIEDIKPNAAYNNSSDIIESLFGKYKARKSPNKLNGVTPFVLFLPLYTELSKDSKVKKFDFKEALENTTMKDVERWTEHNLKPNRMKLRMEKLNKVA